MSVRTGVEVTHSASKISGTLAVVAALIATGASGAGSVLALIFGVMGLAGVVVGIFGLDSRGAVGVGSALLFAAVIASSTNGNSVPLLLAAMIGTVLAMDLGQNAVSVGRQMSDDTFTRRGEFVHAAASTVVGVLVAGFAYGVYLASSGGHPAAALALLVIAALLLIWSFRT